MTNLSKAHSILNCIQVSLQTKKKIQKKRHKKLYPESDLYQGEKRRMINNKEVSLVSRILTSLLFKAIAC